MFDFSKLPFYDNHTHNMLMDKTEFTTRELTCSFLHGFRDVPPVHEGEPFGVSDSLAGSVANLGINKVMVNMLSQHLGCPPTLEAVNEARNKKLGEMGFMAYAKELQEDQNVIGCTVDLDWAIGEPKIAQFPGQVQRLFRMDPLFNRLMENCDTYAALKAQYEKAVRAAVREGFIGIKCHVGERFSFAVKLVDEKDAEACFASALVGDSKALANVYFAVLADTMRICQQLDIPIHIHTGSTGGPENLRDCDPRLMTPFLSIPEFLGTKVVFLHANHPNIGEAALMTHTFPHAWIDISWTLPWIALDFPRVLKQVLGLAPHNKIMLGTGQHSIPEMVWLAAKIAKRSLELVMAEYVAAGFLTKEQAQESAEMVLYKNACRMYGIK
jgi:predicted TIM-barrel fold metal-dependent hydrolase